MGRDARCPLPAESYRQQELSWPSTGRHILAHYDAETIIVYQAYGPEIAHYAVAHGQFGGEFSYSRMSWIKPNFLWMMYRSDWGRAEGQEVVLAVRLRRGFFDSLLRQAVPSSFHPACFRNEADWKAAINSSDVRLQWDPDHLPTGGRCERRAIQLGLRGTALHAYGRQETLEIIDMSVFVREQREHVRSEDLLTPKETVYLPSDLQAAAHIGLDT